MRRSVEGGGRIGELSPASRSPNSPGTTFKTLATEGTSKAFDFAADNGEDELERVEGCRYRMARWYYKLDQWIAKRRSQTILICASMLICVIIMGAFYFVVAPSHYEDGDGLDIDGNTTYPIARSYTDALWDTWGFMADPGTHASQRTPGQRIISLLIAFQGACSRAMRLCAYTLAWPLCLTLHAFCLFQNVRFRRTFALFLS